MIWGVMLMKSLPDPKVLGRLKRKGLGNITIWSYVGSTRCLILVGWSKVMSFWLPCMLKLWSKVLTFIIRNLGQRMFAFIWMQLIASFLSRSFKEPFAPGESSNKPAAILKNYEAIQGLPRKMNPLKTQMILSMFDYAQVNDILLFKSAIFN